MILIHVQISGQDVVGFWKSVNPDKGFTTSILAVYEYKNKIYGQLIVTYDEKTGSLIDTYDAPAQKASHVKGEPFLVKICLFWGLEKKGDRYKAGTVLDPRTGMKFACELWTSGGLLVIRGLVGPFGMNEFFHPASASDFPSGFAVPALTAFVPVLP